METPLAGRNTRKWVEVGIVLIHQGRLISLVYSSDLGLQWGGSSGFILDMNPHSMAHLRILGCLLRVWIPIKIQLLDASRCRCLALAGHDCISSDAEDTIAPWPKQEGDGLERRVAPEN